MPRAYIQHTGGRFYPEELMSSNGVILDAHGYSADRYDDGTRGVADPDKEIAEGDEEPVAFCPDAPIYHLKSITWDHTT